MANNKLNQMSVYEELNGMLEFVEENELTEEVAVELNGMLEEALGVTLEDEFEVISEAIDNASDENLEALAEGIRNLYHHAMSGYHKTARVADKVLAHAPAPGFIRRGFRAKGSKGGIHDLESKRHLGKLRKTIKVHPRLGK